MNRQVIIFSQYSGDLPYVISLIEELRNEKTDIHLFVMNVESNYKFLSSLNLPVKNIHYCSIHFKPSINPVLLLKTKNNIQNYYRKYLSKFNNSQIYFFAKAQDLVTVTFINKLLSNNNRVFFFPASYILLRDTRHNAKLKLTLWLYKMVFGLNLQYRRIDFINKLCLIYDNENIFSTNIELNRSAIKAYSFKPVVTSKAVLFLDSNIEEYNYITDYDKTLENILSLIKSWGVTLYVKGHPRLGITKHSIQYADIILQQHIPIEFIDTESFLLIFGVLTSAMTEKSNSQNNIFSLLDLFSFTDNNIKLSHKNRLIQYSDEKIRFIEKTDELNQLMSSKLS